MNLEKLNLVELNAQEIQETEGGFWWFDWLVNVGGPSIGVDGGDYWTIQQKA
jgi:hypothetical protein